MDFPLPSPYLGMLYQRSRVACRMPSIGNQVGTVFHHMTVSLDDGYPFWYSLHTRRIESAVKAFRCRGWPVKRMIRQLQSQRHLRVTLFCVYDDPGCQLIKVAITAHYETCGSCQEFFANWFAGPGMDKVSQKWRYPPGTACSCTSCSTAGCRP